MHYVAFLFSISFADDVNRRILSVQKINDYYRLGLVA